MRKTILGIAALAALTGCASTPEPPTEALRAAEQAIDQADELEAVEYAALELKTAREKLNAAEKAVLKEEMTLGERLALEARASAELAQARAKAGRAKTDAGEMKQILDTLKDESQRRQGGRP
jgi:hypothetical protein